MLKRTDDLGQDSGAGQSAPEKKPVILIVHQEKSNPGRVARWFRTNGYPVDIRRPRFGCPLPQTLEEHSGAVIFGGPMSANDREDYIKQETDWISVALKEEKPFLGVCLGAQMLARQLGADVRSSRDGSIEVGYYPLTPTPEGQSLCTWPDAVYQWHTEGFDVPAGGVCLAETDAFPNQAFTYGPAAAGVQFHPEITYALVNRWICSRPDRLETKGARSRLEHFQGHFLHAHAVGVWLDEFMSRLMRADVSVS